MQYMKFLFLLIFLLLFHDGGELIGFKELSSRYAVVSSSDDNECTIMVISGTATTDGRPILWKNRDVIDPDHRYLYIKSVEYDGHNTYGFTGNFYASDSSRCYMGVNETGFAIINANCYNLTDNRTNGIDDGDLMRLALEWCDSVEEWEALLRMSGLFGRRDCWMFGVIDASGAAKLYECDNENYVVYDANNSTDAPYGYLLRSVFGMSAEPIEEGQVRYFRAKYLVENYTRNYLLDPKYILQQIATDISLSCEYYTHINDPYPLPFYGSQGGLPVGFAKTRETINRYKTRSCSVIRGVLPNENPLLATTYAVIGQPTLSLAVPLWVGAEYVPYCLRGEEQAPWYLLVAQRMLDLYPLDTEDREWAINTLYLLDSLKTGVHSWSLELERWGIRQAEIELNNWRMRDFDPFEIRRAEIEISNILWNGFVNECVPEQVSIDDEPEALPRGFKAYNYPNPFNLKTIIKFDLPKATELSQVDVNIYALTGERVTSLKVTEYKDGKGSATWDGKNKAGVSVSSGIYFYSIEIPGISKRGKMLLIK